MAKRQAVDTVTSEPTSDPASEPGSGPAPEPEWRERAVARSLQAARTRAEERVQRLLDAAFELIDERGSSDFTVQEIVDRSQQSQRSFYEYFDGKDELVMALFEETVNEAMRDVHASVDAESDPLARLRAFTITLFRWCDPGESWSGGDGSHRRHALSAFSTSLAANHADRVRIALRPQTQLLRSLVTDAIDSGAIGASDVRRASAQVQLTVMYHAFGNRFATRPEQRLDAETTWDFCLRGLSG